MNLRSLLFCFASTGRANDGQIYDDVHERSNVVDKEKGMSFLPLGWTVPATTFVREAVAFRLRHSRCPGLTESVASGVNVVHEDELLLAFCHGHGETFAKGEGAGYHSSSLAIGDGDGTVMQQRVNQVVVATDAKRVGWAKGRKARRVGGGRGGKGQGGLATVSLRENVTPRKYCSNARRMCVWCVWCVYVCVCVCVSVH